MTPAPSRPVTRVLRTKASMGYNPRGDYGAMFIYTDLGAAPERVAALANRRRDPDSRAATVSLNDVLAALD